jgi:2-haloacid dehalogenase
MPRPEAVVFDIGNVLIRWQPEAFYDREIGVDARERLFREVDLHAMNDRIDRGEPFRQVVYETADRHPRNAAAIRLWHDRWIDIAAPAMRGTARLALALQARSVQTFLLSNIGVETFALARARDTVLAGFRRVYLSGAIGVIKPAPEIYATVEADCGLAPEQLLFTDDRAENIAAATERGWQGHLFTGAAALADVLVAHGLLTAEEAELGET